MVDSREHAAYDQGASAGTPGRYIITAENDASYQQFTSLLVTRGYICQQPLRSDTISSTGQPSYRLLTTRRILILEHITDHERRSLEEKIAQLHLEMHIERDFRTDI